MKKTEEKGSKKIFNLYNFAILICIILIVGCIFILTKPDLSGVFKRENASLNSEDKKEKNDVKIIKPETSGEVDEKEASKLAIKQFKELGEDKLKAKDLEVLKIQRDGEDYYYISSPKNTLEIRLKDGNITRINSVKVVEE